ncbi:hypothetical protein C8J56DRAFT_1065294 [Mycena floridula]|nr:hypothetical protein C8J56DRAFT_1065294 [Mycena floridula]
MAARLQLSAAHSASCGNTRPLHGDPIYLSVQHATIPITIITTQVTALIVQATQFNSLEEQEYHRDVDSGADVSRWSSGAIATGIFPTLHPNYADRAVVMTYNTVWISTSAAADVLVAAALIYQLRQMKSPMKNTQSLLLKLTMQAIKTGSSGSIVAVAALIAYLLNRESNIMGRVYSLTLVFTHSSHDLSSCASLQFRNLNTRTTDREHRVTIEPETDSTIGIHHIGSMELKPKPTEV